MNLHKQSPTDSKRFKDLTGKSLNRFEFLGDLVRFMDGSATRRHFLQDFDAVRDRTDHEA